MYSPISFGQKWDKNGDFIRKWVPELKKLDAKYIYEPWTAPLSDQKKAGVRISGDGSRTSENGVATYPKPIFDFKKRREYCLAAMKEAYTVGLMGNDPCILDGTWKDSFGSDYEDSGDIVASDDGENADDNSDESAKGSITGKRKAPKSDGTSKKQKKLSFEKK